MNTTESMRGIYPALLTPYGADGTINYTSLRKLIDFNIDKGVAGFYIAGSTAEVFLLSDQERRELMKAVIEHVNGRVHTIAHIGAISTDHAVSLAKYACELDADAISSVTPFYYGFSLDDIALHYWELVKASSKPLLIYNIPTFSGVSITMEFLAPLLQDERLLGVKHTSNDFFFLERVKRLFPDRLIFNGYDEMCLSGLAAGADGAIGSTFNVMAEKFIRIFNLYAQGNVELARAEQQRANNIIAAMIKTGCTFSAEKALLDMLGIPMGNCRKPFKTLSDAEKQTLYEVYHQNL